MKLLERALLTTAATPSGSGQPFQTLPLVVLEIGHAVGGPPCVGGGKEVRGAFGLEEAFLSGAGDDRHVVV